MQQIHVNGLMGITPGVESAIYDAMTTCTNAQRLTVCLLFMSELPDESHHLTDIERNLRKIFPPSIQGKMPDDYVDFEAGPIRGCFNHQNMDVRDERLRSTGLLWSNVSHGHWRNTEYGNQDAVLILCDRGIELYVRDRLLSVDDVPIVVRQRKYLDEATAE